MTTGLTIRQRKFADGYVRTRRGTIAAIEAGYSPKSAASIASRLLRKDEIKAALKRRIEPAIISAAAPNENPLEYMLRVMRDVEARTSRRDKMAVAAAPFVHVKASDGGKRATTQDAAKKAAAGKFAPTAAPLALVPVRPAPNTNG